jgi:hypothetical protein
VAQIYIYIYIYIYIVLVEGGGNKYRSLTLLVGGASKIETIKYAHEYRETQI